MIDGNRITIYLTVVIDLHFYLARFGLNEPGLQAIAEIVHDIDLKDERFARTETDGIESVLAAIAAAHADDDVRLTRGAQLFDDLYTLFSKSPA